MMPRIIHKNRNSFKNGTDEEKMETALQYKKPGLIESICFLQIDFASCE